MRTACWCSTGSAAGAMITACSSRPSTYGQDLRREPIEIRKRQLGSLLRNARFGLQLNEHIDLPGDVVFRHACKLGFEGIVSKRLGTDPAARGTGSSSKTRTRRRSEEKPKRTGGG